MPDYGDEIFQMLRRTVQADPELQARLFNIFDTDKFVSAICELAFQSGHELQHEEVIQAMRSGRSAWLDRKQT